ncbi:hypothetical protein B9Z19DRAFT_1104637 [Tuber borchii]|uniref:Cell wall protein n=1 Tax=Tuber borchii TaxID=42251 RepID=A0A2T7A932_TUBBO|nr:hypothetical protein B9Z19DRAFT_1104637 [Tuber borchii]
MRLAVPAIAIASLAALVACQSKVVQIEDGQIQGPALSECTPYLVPKPSASPIKPSNKAEQVAAPPPCPPTALPLPPTVHYPTPVATVAPCPPIIFEGGALAREYPVGGAMAFCAVAIALAMI